MSEEMIVRHCAPTLAGMKAGSLFPCPYDDNEEFTDDLARFRALLRPKGLRLLCVRNRPGRALILLYRPSLLYRILSGKDALRILTERGYDSVSPKDCLGELFRRLQKGGRDFPHEVGLFLGYPPDDVSGFIRRDRPVRTVGARTVYGDAEGAERRFAAYRRCTDSYIRRLKNGCPLERLAVMRPDERERA